MELRVLNYFVEASRAENISRAAAKLHVSQPAMSKQLKLLEEELGQKLFKRSNYSIKLTAEGMLFRRRAEDILDMVHKTKSEFAAMDDDISGDVHIGCAESDSFKYVAQAAKILRDAHPGIRFHIYSGNNEDLDYRLEKGLLDFAVVLQSVDAEQFDFLPLPAPDVWGVVMRKDCTLAKKKRICLSDLAGLPLIMSREGMRNEYPSWFGAEFEKLDIAVTFNLFYNAAVMVREGLGFALSIDKIAKTDKESGLCFRPLSPKLTSTLRFIWKKYQRLSPAAALLLQEMKKRYAV